MGSVVCVVRRLIDTDLGERQKQIGPIQQNSGRPPAAVRTHHIPAHDHRRRTGTLRSGGKGSQGAAAAAISGNPRQESSLAVVGRGRTGETRHAGARGGAKKGMGYGRKGTYLFWFFHRALRRQAARACRWVAACEHEKRGTLFESTSVFASFCRVSFGCGCLCFDRPFSLFPRRQDELRELHEFEAILRKEKSLLASQAALTFDRVKMSASDPLPMTKLAVENVCDREMKRARQQVEELTKERFEVAAKRERRPAATLRRLHACTMLDLF